MKLSKPKTALSLLLTTALLVGLISGCQLAQADPATTGDNNTLPTAATLPPTQPIYPKDHIDDMYPWGEIPPGLKEMWEKGWSASPNDTYYTVDLQWAVDMIGLPDAWDITTGSDTIRVGIIDSGVDASHPELQNCVNAELSQSFVSGVSPLEDSLGHGTHIAGIIATQGNNESGISGVCWDVEIVSLRVSGSNNEPNVAAIINAIESANSKDIDILNISINLEGLSTTTLNNLRDAISEFNGLIVCSAGNSGVADDPYADNDTYPWYPTNFRMDNLISVGASTHTDDPWDYSCYGATTVDIFAPGSSILSCYPVQACVDGTCDSFLHNANGYHLMSGTSMAAPHVAGVAALLLSIHPELTAAELKQAILDSVDIIYDANGNSVFGNLCVSGGRLNAYKALTSSSIHNFGPWTDRDAANHSRTCSTCGYVELGAHSDFWDSFHSRCTACNRTGMIIQPYSKKPAEDCTEDCAGDCVHSCADSYAAVCTDACA